MPWRHVRTATRIPVPGGKLIEELFGRMNTGTGAFSLAHMVAPSGWGEPAQRPTFGELTIMVRGRMHITLGDAADEVVELGAGEAFWIDGGERVQYANPYDEESEYFAVCLPAFSPDEANREDAPDAPPGRGASSPPSGAGADEPRRRPRPAPRPTLTSVSDPALRPSTPCPRFSTIQAPDPPKTSRTNIGTPLAEDQTTRNPLMPRPLLDMIYELQLLEGKERHLDIELDAAEAVRRAGLARMLGGDRLDLRARRFVRCAVSLPVQFTRPGGFETGEVQDVGGGGFGIATPQPPEVGTRLVLRITAVAPATEYVFPARVAWRAEGAGRMGVSFDGVPHVSEPFGDETTGVRRRRVPGDRRHEVA